MNDSPLSKLLEWYRKHVKPFLLDHGLEKVEEYDAEIKRLERIQMTLQAKMPACFLGNAGIGKSTLINAIVFGKDIYVPSGGVGPLTAQALTVCYGEHSSFEVLYHTLERYNQVVFGLHHSYLAKLKRADKDSAPASPRELGLDLDGESEAKNLEAFTKAEDPDRQAEELTKQALLMIAGRQDAQRETPYLVDALLAATNKPGRYGSTLLDEDKPRIEGLGLALHHGRSRQPQTRREGATAEAKREFLDSLHHHATGFLAPLIKDLTVRWNSELLRGGLTLVDLPGVGIAGDVKAGITEKYIREHAKAVVLVVSSRGVQQAEAELLRSSGFLNRLLHASYEPSADPVTLMVVVTRMDDIADEHFAQDRSKKRVEHFADACVKVRPMIKQQLRNELEKVWRSVAGLSDEKKGVIDEIIDNLQVHPVSALQYRRFLAQDPEDTSFIKEPGQSNMPPLIEALRDLARAQSDKQQGHLVAEQDRFFRRLRARLEVIRTQWENELHAADEADALRVKLEAFIDEKKLRARFSNRQGAYREFLKSTLPEQIALVVTQAAGKARDEVFSYLEDLQFAHWATLKAAVVRGGAFYGSRHINLPKDFALRFEEPIAEVWGKTILREIRKRTMEYAEDCLALVEEIRGWAKAQGASARTKLLDAEIELIAEDAKRLNAVGKEEVDKLREQVQTSLLNKIENPIKKKCEKFVQDGDSMGPGVKQRILHLFRKLANDTIEAATEPAITLLTAKFRDVETEILAVFEEHKEHNDPIEAAVDALVASHEQRIEREDRKKKEQVLQGLHQIVQQSPIEWDEKPEATPA